MLKFELVLPCYNEGRSLETVLTRAVDAAKESGYCTQDFQLVVVDNGSKDATQDVLTALKQKELAEWFRVVPVMPNRGYGNGIWQGLKTTTAQYVGWSHADQQCDPKDAFRALQIVESGRSKNLLVKGERYGRAPRDRFVSRVFEAFARFILGLRCREVNAQPKVFMRELLNNIPEPPLDFSFDLYVLYRAIKSGFEIRTISVFFPPRVHGVSNWSARFFGRYRTIWGMIRYMLRLSGEEGRV